MADVLKMAKTMSTDCVAHRARQVSRLLTRKYDDSIRSLGIQTSQLFVLVAAAQLGDAGAPMGQLARTLLMDQTTVSRNVVPLQKAGLLKLVASEQDARSRVVVLTPAGKQMIEAAYPLWKAAQRSLAQVLGASRLQALNTELTAIVQAADKLDGAP